MMRRKICLILGAGASMPLGFPSGQALVDEVVDTLSGVRVGHGRDVLSACGFDQDKQAEFAAQLRQSRQPSVDSFLERRPKYLDIGTAAIALCLIPHENANAFCRPKDDGWYDYLFHQMNPASLDAFSKIPLTVVTFNYDRSLEYFLMMALEKSFGAEEKAVAAALSHIPFAHVYGQLGRPHFWDADGCDYAPNRSADDLMKCAKAIDILRVGSGGSGEFVRAQVFISEAELVCFLGFGYHALNVERLAQRSSFHGQDVLGSAFGKANDEQRRVSELFAGYGVQIELGHEGTNDLRFLRDHRVFD